MTMPDEQKPSGPAAAPTDGAPTTPADAIPEGASTEEPLPDYIKDVHEALGAQVTR